MHVTPTTVHETYTRLCERAPATVSLINETRDHLGRRFDTDVDHVDTAAYRREVAVVFADGAVAANVTGYVGLLSGLDVEGDYPGFVVDEVLGRELAATIAGGQPLSVLAQATFHVADTFVHGEETEAAGADDLDAALASGFQTRLPGWAWREGRDPFAIEPTTDV